MGRKGNLGIMITEYGRTREDVVRWPDDPAALQALEEYLDAYPHDPGGVISSLYGDGLDFTGADLSGLDLVGAEFLEANLSGVRMVGSYLGRAWMMGANLRDADLSEANLWKVKGRTSDARGAVLRGANLDRSEFEDCDFRRADLTGARLFSAFLASTDLRDADLRGCSFGLSGGLTGLNKARLAGCRLEAATGRIMGPVDVGEDTPRLLDGDDLRQWFADHGAPEVEIWQPAHT
jgi:hypothetical protein